LLLVAAVAVDGVAAQGRLPSERPSDERIELPPAEVETLPQPVLPRYRPPTSHDTDELATGVRIFVREIRLAGNSAMPTEVLREIARRYEDRSLDWQEIQQLRDDLTRAYVERHYVTSGAVLPDQDLTDGVLEVRLVEGTLQAIEIRTDGRFRPGWLRRRVERGLPAIVDVAALERRLRMLQQDRRIRRVRADLQPGDLRGSSILRIDLSEAPWYRIGLDADSYRNPTIGAIGGTPSLRLDNLIGMGDEWYARFTGSEGLRQVEARVSVPVTTFGTRLTSRYQGSWGEVVDSEAAFLQIESRTRTFGLELRQSLWETSSTSLEGFARFEYRKSVSRIGLLGIGVPTPGTDDGESVIPVLRFGLDGSRRGRTRAIAFRSLVSIGLGVLRATTNRGDVPDARFVSWLSQLQAAQRLPWLGSELVGRADLQLSSDALLPLEQFAVGGRFSVRGYRENTLVRDNGVTGSLELRVPVYHRERPAIDLSLVPFVDAGHSWNTDRGEIGPRTLASIGLGGRALLPASTFVELFWGHPLVGVKTLGDHDLQDDGFQFQVGFRFP
jgi:hemolysin activation/secretion protein